MPPCPSHLTTVAHWAPVPVDRLERMLKVLQNPPNVMGEHTPLHTCACLNHACRVCLMVSKVLTYLPQCLLPPHYQFHSALPACRGWCCGNPHRGTLVVRQGVSPRVGTLVSEQGIEAAFRLGMEREV